MAPGANNVSKDGWSSVSHGWTCGHRGLERLWFSSKLCRRCGTPKPVGAPSAPDAAAQVVRRNRKRGTRPTQKPSTPPEVNLAKVLDGLKDNEHFKGSEERRGRLGKLTSSPNAKHALQRLQSNLRSRPSKVASAMAKSKTKITELEAAAKQAAGAVEEAKQKAEKLQGEIDKLQTEHDKEMARLAKPSDPVTHLQNTVREAFQALSGNLEAQPLTSQLETAFTCLTSVIIFAGMVVESLEKQSESTSRQKLQEN